MTPTAAAADGDDTIGFDNIQNTPTTAATTTTTTTVRKPKQNSSTPLPALNILLVDDSSSTRKMLARYLRMAKMCECPDEAEDGFDAIEKVKSQNDINYYHVILVRGRDGGNLTEIASSSFFLFFFLLLPFVAVETLCVKYA
jgi:hypothetical protein